MKDSPGTACKAYAWPDDYLIPGVEPYFIEDAGIIYCADCRDVLPRLPKVDLVLTDPPYLEDDFSWLIDFIDETRMVVSPGKIKAFDWIKKKKPDWEFIWLNSALSLGGAFCLHIGFEPLLAYGKPYKPLGNDVLNYSISKQSGIGSHPWPKPTKLLKKILIHWSKENHLILDPFLGSGTTAVAAKELGRRYIGIEIEEKYCEIAVKRLKQCNPLLFQEIEKKITQKEIGFD